MTLFNENCIGILYIHSMHISYFFNKSKEIDHVLNIIKWLPRLFHYQDHIL